MVSCPHCHRFVKVREIWIEKLWCDIVRVDAVCSRCGEVNTDFTDYDELIPPEKFDDIHCGTDPVLAPVQPLEE